jgi:hypothetical protein
MLMMKLKPIRRKFNLVLPKAGSTSPIFGNLSELLQLGLEDLGHNVMISCNRVKRNAQNIIISPFFKSCFFWGLPRSSIIVNTEHLLISEAAVKKVKDAVAVFTKHAHKFTIWDYSQTNVESLESLFHHHNTRHLELGFHPRLERIEKASVQDIDVLFYGSPSPRRDNALAKLRDAGLKVHVERGAYGRELDALISRSKIVLIIPFYEKANFDSVRVHYLMNNGKAIVYELNNLSQNASWCLEGIQAVTLDNLVYECLHLTRNEVARRRLEKKARSVLSHRPQSQILKNLL